MPGYYYNATIYIPPDNRDYSLNTRPGYKTHSQCELLTEIYTSFADILNKNGKITKNDLKEVYLKYDEKLKVSLSNATEVLGDSLAYNDIIVDVGTDNGATLSNNLSSDSSANPNEFISFRTLPTSYIPAEAAFTDPVCKPFL